jgi:DNA modification methylase
MVEVFQGIHRVLAPHGTAWLNLGDSYAGARSYQVSDSKHPSHDFGSSNSMEVPAGLKAKDLVGIPWRVALALQTDGWYLRSDIIWNKLNPMPESVTDRPTKAHEYIFLLSKNSRYFFDQENVREPAEWNRWGTQTNDKYEGTQSSATWIPTRSKFELEMARKKSYPPGDTTGNRGGEHIKGGSGGMPSSHPAGRNIRTVWEIPTQSYADAHFATFPKELPRRAILAGCPEQVCRECGKPQERIVQRSEGSLVTETVGWTDCGHDRWRRGVVLDPFMGSGTVALVARELDRHSIGVELSSAYCGLIADRLKQLSLLA